MKQENAKYIDCHICGTSILEQCAIEEDGQFSCGECVINETKKEVNVVEEAKKKKREEEYEIERQKLILKKKKQGVIVLVVSVIVLILSQFVMKLNQPEPVHSVTVDYTKDLYAAKSLITIGIYKYMSENEQLPIALDKLAPGYVPIGLDETFHSFKYIKLNDELYELEIIPPSSVSQTGENDEE